MTSSEPPPAILATYRLQLHAGFPLARARDLVPYLARLGVTHLHASPILRARAGSLHGYDVTDPGQLNPELGNEDDLERLVAALRSQDMGIVLDIVPNHMAASPENWRWEDVLTNGPASPYARWFDIEWRVGEPQLHSRVLIPILGDARPRVLASGELQLRYSTAGLRVHYHEHSLPLDPSTWPLVLARAIEECDADLGADHAATRELRAIVTALERLPRRSARKARTVVRRRRLAADAVRALRRLCRLMPEVRRRVERAASWFGEGPEGLVRLRRLLDLQAHRLAYWRRAAREINYRRFFDVNDLVALHMEDPEVFARSHALVLDWIRAGYLDGLRVDHVDGLLDPLGYLQRLAEQGFHRRPAGPPPVFVEKILSHGERLRDEWPVAGTTGYDFLNDVGAAFISPAGARLLERDYRRIVRRHAGFTIAGLEGKRQALETGLSAGVRRLAERLLRLSGGEGIRPAVRTHDLARAIVETIVHLPVYRTYLDERRGEPAPVDRALLEDALAAARPSGRASAAAFDTLAAALLGDPPAQAPDEERLRRRFVQRLQQMSGPATAKGVEDTAAYVHVPLVSRNEVGSAPDAPLADAVAALHEGNRHRAAAWPHTMLALTTHDTKRSADVRARLDVLSEVPEEWEGRVYRWRRWNRGHRSNVGGRLFPDANTEYLLYQTLVGAWPLGLTRLTDPAPPAPLVEFRERVAAYMLKAAREAKLETSWVEPDGGFEAALDRFVRAILDPVSAPEFLSDLAGFVERVARPGLWNALARVLVQLTAPGVPDLYQGDEVWRLLLVDPDNRQPVDFRRRRVLLDGLARDFADEESRPGLLRGLVERPEDGRVKLHVVHRTLHLRRRLPELFLRGSYEPLVVEGPAAEHVVAFVRRAAGAAMLVAVPRLIAGRLAPGRLPPPRASWSGTHLLLPPMLAAARWRSALTGEQVGRPGDRLEVGDLLDSLPVALLVTPPEA